MDIINTLTTKYMKNTRQIVRLSQKVSFIFEAVMQSEAKYLSFIRLRFLTKFGMTAKGYFETASGNCNKIFVPFVVKK